MKKITILIITFILIIISTVLIVLGFNLDYTVKDTDSNEFDIIGKWYAVYDMTNFEYEFNEDGTYVITDLSEYGNGDSTGNYTLNKADGSLILSEKHQYKDRVEYDDNNYVIEEADSDLFKMRDDDELFYLYKNKDERRPYDEVCLNPDKKGYCIEDGVLVSYIGNDEEITIPSNVHTIASDAFAGDYNRGINTRKVTIPGTVKEIKSSAFAFTRVDVVVIKEGVETLGGNIFMDTCITEIHFPKSIKSGGGGMFNPEEQCGSIDIHLYKDSYIHKELIDDDPYYSEVNFIYK